MKQHIGQILFVLMWMAASMMLLSCEDVIDLGLTNAEPKLVVEGWIDNKEGPVVKLSKTTAFSADLGQNPQQIVAGAKVAIHDDKGHWLFLNDAASPGYYLPGAADDFIGRPGRTYTLHVETAGEIYEAVSTMPMPVPIDSVGTVTSDIFGEARKGAGLLFTDPPGVKNQYRYEVWVNNVFLKSIFVYNDKYNDGKTITRELINYDEDDDDKQITPGDRVHVLVMNIDEAVYKYWFSLDENNPGSAAPGNPVSNISNGALGYFSAQSVQQVDTVIE